ncbi:MAG: LamG-like jellyroll fold domain-containing protein [Armatimonadota bacterium]
MKTLAFTATLLGILVGMCSLCADAKVVQTGLISWWRCDEGNNSVLYDEINFEYGNNGTILGAAWAAGKVGNALSFDGSDDYVVCGDAPFDIGTGDFTLEAWINTNASSDGYIIGKRGAGGLAEVNGYYFYLCSNGMVYFRMENDNGQYCYIIGGNAKSVEGWHHVAVTVDRDSATGLKLYVDGTQCGASANPTNVANSLANSIELTLGKRYPFAGSSSDTFYGSMDDVRIYSRALSSTEVSQNYTVVDFKVSDYGGSLADAVDAAIASGAGRVLIDQDVTAANVDLSGADGLIIEGAGGHIFRGGNEDQHEPVFLAICCTDVVFQSLYFEGAFDTETEMYLGQCIRTDNTYTGGETVGMQIRNCTFYNTSGDAIRLGPNTFNTVIKHCSMLGCLGFVEMSGVAQSNKPVDGVQIKYNYIECVLATASTYRLSVGISGSDDLIDAWGNVINVDIAHNLLEGMSDTTVETISNHGILVLATTYTGDEGMHGWHIYENVFQNITNDGHYPNMSGAIYCYRSGCEYTDAVNMVIEDNQIINCRNGLAFGYLTDAGIFRDNAVTAIAVYPVHLLVTANYQVEGNTLETYGGDACLYMQGDGNVADDNDLNVGVRFGILISTGNAQEATNNTITVDEHAGPNYVYIGNYGTNTVLSNNTYQ